MTTFVALYRGETIGGARLVAVSADPSVVSYVANRLITDQQASDDPAIGAIDRGRRAALRAIKQEGTDAVTHS